jgi:putative zinc finger/helix-turn-helix YgiT family protein
MNTIELPKCPVCRKGQLLPSTTQREFLPRGMKVSVELLTSVCNHCGKETVRAAQHEENLRRLADRKYRREYAGLLLGEEILALRHRYGLKQQDASKIFGKGKIAFSRYENEVTYPDDSTTRLLKLAIQMPEALKRLADDAGVAIPLWQERCEDRRLSIRKVPSAPGNLRVLESVDIVAPSATPETTTAGWHEVQKDGHIKVEVEAKIEGHEIKVMPMLEAA